MPGQRRTTRIGLREITRNQNPGKLNSICGVVRDRDYLRRASAPDDLRYKTQSPRRERQLRELGDSGSGNGKTVGTPSSVVADQ